MAEWWVRRLQISHRSVGVAAHERGGFLAIFAARVSLLGATLWRADLRISVLHSWVRNYQVASQHAAQQIRKLPEIAGRTLMEQIRKLP